MTITRMVARLAVLGTEYLLRFLSCLEAYYFQRPNFLADMFPSIAMTMVSYCALAYDWRCKHRYDHVTFAGVKHSAHILQTK
jgi:hypothetical protein